MSALQTHARLCKASLEDMLDNLSARLPIWNTPQLGPNSSEPWPEPEIARARQLDASLYVPCGACGHPPFDCECGEEAYAMATFGRVLGEPA